MKYQRPKGTADILPGDSEKWQFIEKKARALFKKFRYQEMRTPIFENFEVFSRTSGETSDIVTKEMYDFFDKGDRHVTLRPEGTAGVVRSYVENKLYGPEIQKPFKTYYIGPMFRYERPQAGRFREFHQIGVEAFGVDNPTLDVEVIAMAIELLKSFGLNSLKLALNTLGDNESRAAYRQALIDYLDAKKHFETVKSLLDDLGIEYEIDSNMVRGLDYYNHTIFEIMSDSKVFSGKWTTVCAGGRYNGLVEQLGGPETPGIGFALGVERLLLILEAEEDAFDIENDLDVYVVGIGESTNAEALKIAMSLRRQGFSADRDYLSRKPKAQFKTASKLDAKYTLTIGETELAEGKANLKKMETGEEISVSLNDVYEDFAKLAK